MSEPAATPVYCTDTVAASPATQKSPPAETWRPLPVGASVGRAVAPAASPARRRRRPTAGAVVATVYVGDVKAPCVAVHAWKT